MSGGTPRVSLGLPVFNGERFLAEALDSILTQTYPDWELIISDNASTDRTAEICRAYAARDPRIRYYRNESNLGAGWNFNRTFSLSSGEYFKWVAHDDALEPAFLEKCVELLDCERAVVLCFCRMVDIDAQGNELQVRGAGTESHADRIPERFWSLIRFQHKCEEVFGLVRADVMRKTKLIANYSDSDRTLLAELSLHGPFHEISDVLFRHRVHSQSSVALNPARRQRMAWFDPRLSGRTALPCWQQFFALWAAIGRSPISWKERASCGFYLLRWGKRHRRRLSEDLVWAAKRLLAAGADEPVT